MKCPKCGAEFEPRQGNQKYCGKKCLKQAHRRRYYEKHKEQCRAYNREYSRAYYAAHKEEILLKAKRRRWYGVSGVR